MYALYSNGLLLQFLEENTFCYDVLPSFFSFRFVVITPAIFAIKIDINDNKCPLRHCKVRIKINKL